MAIHLNRLELANIRRHRHFVFEPLDTGITAIKGPSGAGKSTIVDSLAWVLFGNSIKPKTAKTFSDLVNDHADLKGGDRAYVEGDFTINGERFLICREFFHSGKTISTQCFIHQWNDELEDFDPSPVIEGSVNDGNAFIRKKLLMDSTGFKAAVFTQQKALDDVLTTGRGGSAGAIENLIGVSSLTLSAKDVADQLKVLRKVTELANVSEDTVTSLETELETAVANLETLEASADSLTSLFSSVENQLNSERFLYKEEHERLANWEELKEAESRTVELATKYGVELSSRKNALERAKATVASKSKDNDSQLPALHADLKNKLQEAQSKLTTGATKLDSLRKQVVTKKSQLASLTEKLEVEEPELASLLDNLRSERDQLKEILPGKRSELAQAQSQLDTLKGTITGLGTGICPTCQQPLANFEDEKKALEAKVEPLETLVATLKPEVVALETKLESVVTRGQEAKQAMTAHEELESLRAEGRELKASLPPLQTSVDSLVSKMESMESDMARLSEKAVAVSEMNSAQREFDSAQSLLEGSQKKLADIREPMNQFGAVPAQDGLDARRSKIAELDNQHRELSTELAGIKATVEAEKKSVAMLETTASRERERWEEHQDNLLTIERLSAIQETLAEFKQERVDSSVPEIESYASEILSGFTDGAFTGVHLDSKFQVTVTTKDGHTKSVSTLSGGEYSAVALALRLAINLMLNGDTNQNFMVLDEITGSQDNGRIENIFRTIKEYFTSQVIIIAHSDFVDSIVDKAVEL